MPAKYFGDFKLTLPKITFSHSSPYSLLCQNEVICRISQSKEYQSLAADKEPRACCSSSEFNQTSRAWSLPAPSLRRDAGTRAWLGIVLSQKHPVAQKAGQPIESLICCIISHFYTNSVTHALREYLPSHPYFAFRLHISLYD